MLLPFATAVYFANSFPLPFQWVLENVVMFLHCWLKINFGDYCKTRPSICDLRRLIVYFPCDFLGLIVFLSILSITTNPLAIITWIQTTSPKYLNRVNINSVQDFT